MSDIIADPPLTSTSPLHSHSIEHHRQVKILRIKLRNLNSLRGEHVVDFTKEPLASASIFAITGPTGAGKSTLLDAMTLALFGQAARYQNDRNPENMMSRHSSDCLAEVMFSVNQDIYRAEWQLRRAKGKTDGKIQPPVRFLYDAQEKPMNRLATECTQEIERITGLNYQRFLRSVLLAQGEFSRFLKASADERAELLESLTGTEMYSELGILAHTEYVRRESELSAIRAELAHYQLLSEEEILAAKQSLTLQNTQLDQLKTQSSALQQRLRLGEEWQKNQLAQASQAERKQLLLDEKTAKQTWLEQLTLHQRAVPYSADLFECDRVKELAALAHLQANDSTKQVSLARDGCIEQLTKRLHLEECQFTKHNHQLTSLRQTIIDSEKQSSVIREWLAEHRHLESLENALPSLQQQALELHVHHRNLALVTGELANLDQEISLWEKQSQASRESLAQTKILHEQSIAQLQQHQSNLKTCLAPWPGLDAETALDKCRKQQQKWRDLIAVRHQLHTYNQEINQLKSSAESLHTKQENEQRELAAAKLHLTAKEQDVSLKRDHLRLAERVASLDDHRAALRDGETCPLCGSLDHPLRQANAQAPNLSLIQQALQEAETHWRAAEKSVQTWQQSAIETQTHLTHSQEALTVKQQVLMQLSTQAASLHAELELPQEDDIDLEQRLQRSNQQEQELKLAWKQVTDAEQKSRDTQHAFEQAEQKSKDQSQRLLDVQNQREQKISQRQLQVTTIETLTQDLTKSIEPFQLKLPDFSTPILALDAWQKSAQHYPRGTQKLADLLHVLEKQRLEETHLQKESQTSAASIEKLRQQLTTELAVSEKTLEEMLALQAAPSATREQLQAASDNARTYLERVTAQASMLSSQAQQASIDLQQKEQRLLENLTQSPFEDLSFLRAALLTDDEWRARNDWLVDWEKREQQRLTLLGAAEQRLAELAALHAPDPETCATLRHESAALEQTMLELAKEHTLLEEKLRRDAQQREAYERRSAESEQQLKELEIWQIMRGLIGSHDGAKFRKFAQGVSLDILTHHANKHLQQLSERYRLQRQEHVDLTLEIIDQFQANCTRPMSSLSGGESFLVSLALALGLSDLAGRNVRIDSLFIDEGFGSLDADALDAAISTLESLHQQNKTIGVISHIDLVKERIHTKINVRRLSAGSSTLDVA